LRRPLYYLLDGHTPYPVDDVLEWATASDGALRSLAWRVAYTGLPGGAFVSTVFLGIDHAFFDGPPLLFETMIFGAERVAYTFGGRERTFPEEIYQWRYHTWDEAIEGHQAAASLFDIIERAEGEQP
jgi:hypothetical protein